MDALFYITVVLITTVIGWAAIGIWHKHGDPRKIFEFASVLLLLILAVAMSIIVFKEISG